jgi:hypothetical protein
LMFPAKQSVCRFESGTCGRGFEKIVHTADGAGRGNARNRAEGMRTGEKCRRVLARGVQRTEEVALDMGVGTRTRKS